MRFYFSCFCGSFSFNEGIDEVSEFKGHSCLYLELYILQREYLFHEFLYLELEFRLKKPRGTDKKVQIVCPS